MTKEELKQIIKECIIESFNNKSTKEKEYNILEKIKKENKKLAVYEYIIVTPDGKVIREIKAEDFKNYKILSPTQFEKYKGGICWDYVSYESIKLSYVKHKSFFFCMVDKNGNPRHTHTFLLFYLNNKTYWFESSWKSHIGIFEFDSEDIAISHITNSLISIQNGEYNNYIVEYNPSKYTGFTEDKFLEAMSRLPEYKYTNIKNPRKRTIQYIKLDNNGKISDIIEED